MERTSPFDSVIHPHLKVTGDYQHFSANTFPLIQPIHWLTSHFAVGGWSPLQRLSGMLTAHMTQIAPRNGFTWHPHRGLEIYTWVLEGQLYHEDTTGGKGVIQAGELQRMFSGHWIEHQELNQWDVPARVIQIWFAASTEFGDVAPHYQQVSKAQLPAKQAGDATVLSLIGDDSPMIQHMTGRLKATILPAGGTTTVLAPRTGEDLFLYVTDGSGCLSDETVIGQYDVILARSTAEMPTIKARDDLHYLSFYLPAFL